MAEFKFSCPQCSQHIQCDTGHAGVQINCPTCQQAIVVPQAPGSAAAPPPQPIRSSLTPSGLTTSRSTMAPSGERHFPGAAAAQPVQAKSHTLRNVLVITAVVAVFAALGFGGWHIYSKHKAKLGNPAAQVPKPSVAAAAGAQDVMAKVLQAYGGLTSLSAEGTSLMVMDMSGITAADISQNTPAQKKKNARTPNIPKAMTNMTEVSIKLARPNLYRIEGQTKTEAGRMTMTNTTATWSTGKTNYSLMVFGGGSYKNYTTVADRKSAIMMNGQAGGLVMAIPQMFFGEADNLGKIITDWGQTEDASVNGEDCLTLTAKMMGQKLKIWVSKTSYMILKSQITLGGAISDEDITTAINTFDPNTNKTPQQLQQEVTMAKQQAVMMTKLRGTITESYDVIETNTTYAADDFNYPVPPGVQLNAAPQFRGRTPAASSSKASQRNACINNLRQLDAAKNQFALENRKTTGDAVTEADIKPYIKLDADGNLPKCPAGGKYTIGKVGKNPTCSIPDHVLP